MAKVSASVAINKAFDAVRPGWSAAWGTMLLVAAANTALQVWAATLATPAAVARASIMANLSHYLLIIPIVVALIVAAVMAYAGLYRIGLGQSSDLGPAGLQWNAQEWRVLGATALILLIVLPPAAGWGGLVSFETAKISAGHVGGAALAVFWTAFAALLILVALLIWVSTRLSPFLAATIDQKRVVLFSVWGLTQGCFWAIFGASFVVGLASGLVGVLGQILALAIKAGEGAIVHPTVVQAIAPALVQSVAGIALMPAKIGLMVYFYKALRPNQAQVADIFS